jgi:hypothetical protein
MKLVNLEELVQVLLCTEVGQEHFFTFDHGNGIPIEHSIGVGFIPELSMWHLWTYDYNCYIRYFVDADIAAAASQALNLLSIPFE